MSRLTPENYACIKTIQNSHIFMVIVDECHCITEWGIPFVIGSRPPHLQKISEKKWPSLLDILKSAGTKLVQIELKYWKCNDSAKDLFRGI